MVAQKPAMILLAVCAMVTAQQADVWMKLFDGKDLAGWQGKTGYWVVDTNAPGVIIGTHPANAAAMNGQNTFLFTDSLFGDFHLKMEGRMPTMNPPGYRNSGIMYRSTIVDKITWAAMGYQYEISDGGTGAFYHERGNPMELPFTGGCPDSAGGATNWKRIEIIANGPHVTHLMGNRTCFDYTTFRITAKGYIGLQLHAPGDFAVNFRNIFIQPLNNSFRIPPDNMWDGNGNKINPLGITPRPKGGHKSNRVPAGVPGAFAGFDARGRAVTEVLGGSQAHHDLAQALGR